MKSHKHHQISSIDEKIALINNSKNFIKRYHSDNPCKNYHFTMKEFKSLLISDRKCN